MNLKSQKDAKIKNPNTLHKWLSFGRYHLHLIYSEAVYNDHSIAVVGEVEECAERVDAKGQPEDHVKNRHEFIETWKIFREIK